ncbi:hypothetical protein MSAN_00479700 [Mycena sanguinolenta]|uniref:Uncharacterized protein n=1 Tax=Mycena sanguinolenta TaxID=230812 RepID=A0A8H6Z5K2_9AGAR|nr:hypothetical protein MSAN_00479700 [Mycena sanguinolenta]
MPTWMGDVLLKFFADRNAVEANKGFWPRTTKPTIDDPLLAYAAWYQHQGLAPECCPFLDDFHTLNARRLRGFRVWNTIVGSPNRGATADLAPNDPILAIARAVLFQLIVPNSYAQDIKTYNVKIAAVEKLQLWPCKQCEPADLSDGALARGLAAMGLQPSTVDDTYEYLCALASGIIVKSRTGWDVEEVKNLLVACDEVIEAQGSTPPPGLAEPYGELLFHPPGLPWPDKQLNMIQDKLILIKDIPMPPAFSSSSFRFFNFTVAPKAVASPPRGTAFSRGGGYRGRGGGFAGRGRGFGPRTVVTGATMGMLPQAMYPAPPPYAQQQPASTTATAAVTSTAPGSTQQPTPQPQLAPAAYWHGNAPTAAPSYSGVSSTPASHALQQQFNTATLFALPDAGLNYPSTSSAAFMLTTLSHAPAAFHGGNDALHTPFSALGFEYLPTSSDLNLPPR